VIVVTRAALLCDSILGLLARGTRAPLQPDLRLPAPGGVRGACVRPVAPRAHRCPERRGRAAQERLRAPGRPLRPDRLRRAPRGDRHRPRRARPPPRGPAPLAGLRLHGARVGGLRARVRHRGGHPHRHPARPPGPRPVIGRPRGTAHDLTRRGDLRGTPLPGAAGGRARLGGAARVRLESTRRRHPRDDPRRAHLLRLPLHRPLRRPP